MKNYQYALFSQGDDIQQLLEKIFKVASILCFMSIQIPIPKVSFYTPLALPTTKILSYLYMYDYTSKPPLPPPHCVKSKQYT